MLVLSENAGAHEELGEWALTVNPFDLSGQADALYEALVMPAGRARAAGRGDCAPRCARTTSRRGSRAQLADLDAVRRAGG